MASATSHPLPAWPQLMTLDLACAYTSLSANSFRLLAGKYGVQPVECAPSYCGNGRNPTQDTTHDH